MQSLNRNRELQEILGPLTAFVDGSARPGDTRVLCRGVSCLPRGGLTLFLSDLMESLAADARFLPICLTMADSRRAEAELRAASEALANHVGRSGRIDGQPETFISLAEAVWQTGRLAVLVLDASAALTQLRTTDELRDRAASNQLLIDLRALPTLITHHRTALAAVLGCHDDFLDHAADLGAQDVVQRYRWISLWPDFGVADPWPIYREILEARGHRVAADFSGFPRSGLPVGEVLAALNGPEQTVDGTFLLEVLSEHRKIDKARLGTLDSQLTIALGLQDRTVDATDGDLLQRARSLSARWAVQPVEGGRYQATTELYKALGLAPPRVRLSFAERLRRRFEIDHDLDVAVEFLRGVRALAGAGNGPVERADEFALTVLPLPDDWWPPTAKVRPTLQPTLRVYACVAETLPPALTDAVQEDVERIEKDMLQTRELVVVLYREPRMDVPLRADVLRRLADRKVEPIKLASGGPRAPRDSPSALCPVEITFPVVQGAVSFDLDPGLEDEFVEQAHAALSRGISGHYRAVTRVLKPLSAGLFDGQVLTRLIANTPVELSVRELQQSSGGLKADRVTDIVRGLEELQSIHKGNNGYRWTYGEDQLLAMFPPGTPRRADDLVRKFFFDRDHWPELVTAMRGAYGAELLGGIGDVIEGRDPSPLLKHRADAMIRQIEEHRRQLHVAGDPAASSDLATSLEQERQVLHDDPNVTTLEGVCARLSKLCRDAVQYLNDVQRRRHEKKRELVAAARTLRDSHEIHDQTLQSERVALLADLDAAVSDHAVSLDRLETLRRNLDGLLARFEAENRCREDNIDEAVSLAKQCRTLLERLGRLPASDDEKLRSRRADLEQRLKQAKEEVGDPKQHPPVAGETRRAQLQSQGEAINIAREELHKLELAIEASRLRPSTPSPTPQPPAPAVDKPLPPTTIPTIGTPPSSGRQPTPQPPPVDSNSITVPPGDEPPKTVHETPAIGSCPPIVPPPVPDLPAVPDPAPWVPTVNVPTPQPPPQPAVPSRPIRREHRFKPEELDQLADLLRRYPHIVDLQVIE